VKVTVNEESVEPGKAWDVAGCLRNESEYGDPGEEDPSSADVLFELDISKV